VAKESKAIKDMTREELIEMAEKQSDLLLQKEQEIAKIKEDNKKKVDNLISVVNDEFKKLSDSFRSIQTTCQMSVEHIAKIGK